MLSEVIALARRRLLWNALAFQFAVAVIVALAVLALLLFLGTDIVDTRWLVVLPLASLAAGTWVAHRRLPGSYPTAQLLDRRLMLTDALSTAMFFERPHPDRRCDEGTRQAQHEQAARIAADVDLRQAIPFKFPRAIYFAILPAIVAAGLFNMRYRVGRASRPANADDRCPPANRAGDRRATSRRNSPNCRTNSSATIRRNEWHRRTRRMAPPEIVSRLKPPTPLPKTGRARRSRERSRNNNRLPIQQTGSDPGSPSSRENEGRQQQQQAAAAQQAGSSSADSSVMSKLRDSMSNLLSLAKPQPGGSGKQQMGKSQDGHPQNSRGENAQGIPTPPTESPAKVRRNREVQSRRAPARHPTLLPISSPAAAPATRTGPKISERPSNSKPWAN